jgi:hypothetical protein
MEPIYRKTELVFEKYEMPPQIFNLLKLYPQDDRELIKQLIIDLLHDKMQNFSDSKEILKALLGILSPPETGLS